MNIDRKNNENALKDFRQRNAYLQFKKIILWSIKKMDCRNAAKRRKYEEAGVEM